jgi:hypothetical protein
MTPGDEIAALRAEVAVLRQRVRTLFALTLGVLITVIVLIALTRRPPGVRWDAEEARAEQVEANQYRLLDPDGNLRGLWNCPPAGPSLVLTDDKGRPAIVMRGTSQGGTFQVKDATGRVLFEKP